MKKTILPVLAGLLLSAAANAQVAFGPELGLNISTLTETQSGPYRTYAYTYDPKAGAKVGGIAEIPLSRNFYLQPGIFFSQKGAQLHDPGGSYIFDINYIEVPVNILYKFGRPSGNRFFLGAGLVAGVVAGGHYPDINGNKQKLLVGNDYNTDDVRGFDAGISGQLGYQLSSGFIFRLQSEAGFANIAPGGDADYGLYNYATTISVAYLFGTQHNHVDKRKKPGARIR